MANYRPNLSHFWANQRNFRDLNLVTYILTKNVPILESLLTRISLPKNPENCHSILVALLKIQPHYSQSSRENATPYSGTSQLAYYKKVPYWTTIVKVASTRTVTLHLNDNLLVSEGVLLGISERNKLCRYSFLLAKHSGNSWETINVQVAPVDTSSRRVLAQNNIYLFQKWCYLEYL